MVFLDLILISVCKLPEILSSKSPKMLLAKNVTKRDLPFSVVQLEP